MADAPEYVVKSQVGSYEGRPVLGRREAALVTQGQRATVEWVLRNPAADPLDLTPYTGASSESSQSATGPFGAPTGPIRVRLLEALSMRLGSRTVDAVAWAHAPTEGVIRFALPDRVSQLPAVYLVELALFEGDSLVVSNQGWLLVECGLFGADKSTGGPPALAEVRLAVRNSASEDSYLLDDAEWDLAEYCQCLLRPVAYFNDSRPPIHQKYTTATFGRWREAWLGGVIAELYALAASSYLREDVEYQAGGTALADKRKAQPYMQKAQTLQQQYRAWVKATKVGINCGAFVGTVPLFYRHR